MRTRRKVDRTLFILGAVFLGALGLQLTRQEFFARLVPGYLAKYRDQVAAATRALLGVSGLSLLLSSFGAPLKPVARVAALGVLLPSLPEAFNQVREPERMRAVGVPPQVALARIPVQLLVIAMIWRATGSVRAA